MVTLSICCSGRGKCPFMHNTKHDMKPSGSASSGRCPLLAKMGYHFYVGLNNLLCSLLGARYMLAACFRIPGSRVRRSTVRVARIIHSSSFKHFVSIHPCTRSLASYVVRSLRRRRCLHQQPTRPLFNMPLSTWSPIWLLLLA